MLWNEARCGGEKDGLLREFTVERPMSHMPDVGHFGTSSELDMTVGGAWE